jgi:PAS domain S-box-containing protein
MLMGSFILVTGFLGSVRMHRWQIMLAVFSSLFPWIGNLIYISGLSPIEHLDLTPFFFTISALLFTISLFRFRLVQILPIAQQTVFESQADGLLVLDLQDNIVDMNPAARTQIPYEGDPLGKPIAQVMPELAQWLAQRIFEGEFREEVSYGEGSDRRTYDLRITPLTGLSSGPVGRLIVGHDITEHKQQEAHLESVVSERTETLRETVEQLQRELTQRTLAERRFEEVVESAPDAMLLVDQLGVIRLVNLQAEKLFGYTREELLGQNIETLIPIYRRSKHMEHVKSYVANPKIRQISFDLDLSAQRKDGNEFPVEISLGPLDTQEGLLVACNVRDISARKQADQEQRQLLEQIQLSREQLIALTHRLQEVQEYERRQIAAELHDRVGQNLTGLNLNLQIIHDQVNSAASPALRSRLEDSQQLLEETTRQVRDVMADLHPPMLDEYGLVSTLHWYCGIFSRRTGIATRVIGDELNPRLPARDETALFRIVQEALNNVIRHANANEVLIILESLDEAACLIVKDNGRGFITSTTEVHAGKAHWGLLNIEQRAASIGGELAIDSAPGKGTKLSIILRRSNDED